MPFATRYHDHTPEQIFTLRKELLNHSHVLRYAAEMNMTLKQVVDWTMLAWRDGVIEPTTTIWGASLDFGKHPFLEMIGKTQRECDLIAARIKAVRTYYAVAPHLKAAEEKRRRKAERKVRHAQTA